MYSPDLENLSKIIFLACLELLIKKLANFKTR